MGVSYLQCGECISSRAYAKAPEYSKQKEKTTTKNRRDKDILNMKQDKHIMWNLPFSHVHPAKVQTGDQLFKIYSNLN